MDSKTLKYQYQSAQREQNELRRKIENLEKNSETNKLKITELNTALCEEKELSAERLSTCESLRHELAVLEQKWKESSTENQKLIERVNELVSDLEKKKEIIKSEQEKRQNNAGSNISIEEKESSIENKDEEEAKTTKKDKEAAESRIDEISSEQSQNSFSLNTSIVSNEQLMNIEGELVLLKEKYAQSCEEKVKLQRDLLKLRVQYDMVCDNMYNKYFWYIGPLVLIVVYLLIREWIS